MAKVGGYYRAAVLTPGSPIALNTNFNASSVAMTLDGGQSFGGHLGSAFVYLNTVAGGATKLTLKLTRDAAGDEAVVTSTQGDIEAGVTTAADGSLAIKIDIPWVFGDGTALYPFFKLDAGTANMVSCIVCWRE